MCVCMLSHFSHVPLFATVWTAAHQAPVSMRFSRQGYWSGLSFPSAGDLPDPGTGPMSPASPALAGGLLTTVPPRKPHLMAGEGKNLSSLASEWREGRKSG